MNMANLIAERRKEKGLTQKQLAEKLDVTDKAVSKWERGNGLPAIDYLQPLADALDISVSELLQGEASSTEDKSDEANDKEDGETIIKKALDYAETSYKEKNWSLSRIVILAFIGILLVGILTVSIVDFAMNQSFTWSLIPTSCIVFAGLCKLPLLFLKKHAVDVSLAVMSVLIFPFLYIISVLTGGNWFFTVAAPVALAGLVIIWAVRGVFATKLNVWYKIAICLLIGIVADIGIDFMIAKILGMQGGGFDIWSLMTIAILVVLAGVFFIVGYVRRGKRSS